MGIDREESLFLTVSEDHRKRKYPEYIRLMSAPYRAAGGMVSAYEGVVLGGGDRLLGLEELDRWLRRHRYAAFDMDILLPIAHLCLEELARRRLAEERPGVPAMAEQAAWELLGRDPLRWRHASRHWLNIYWLTERFPQAATPESRRILTNFDGFEPVLRLFTQLMDGCGQCTDARSLVELAVQLYKRVFTRYSAPNHSADPLPQAQLWDQDTWRDTSPEEPTPPELQTELRYGKARLTGDGVELSEEELAAVPDYLAKHFGPSFLDQKALEELQRAVCVGIHQGRRLLFTDGLPRSAYEGPSPQAAALRAGREANLRALEDNAAAARQGIRSIERAFRDALNLRDEPERCRSHWGTLVNSQLWKAGRLENPRLFQKTFRQEPSTVVVELLIDASGSQAGRQAMVALQSYLFSAALSRIPIPHRVMSFLTYGDHTVLRRFRDYDDGPEACRNILEYRATANNRDGLALAAAGEQLLKRREDHKILIVLSDGLPNDMVSGRRRPGDPEKYVGQAAIQDTCGQIRRLRRAGVHVTGVFLGEDGELENERMIYGSSFLRLRRTEDFGGSAGKRLSEILLLL